MSRVGTYVGRILVQSLLGRGGMGEVYVGYDETLGPFLYFVSTFMNTLGGEPSVSRSSV